MGMKKKPKKMGRPLKRDKPLTDVIVVRVTRAERKAFKEAARAARMELGPWLIQPRRDELEKAR